MTALLALDRVSIAIGGRTLVSDVSFELAAGECLGLVGASGSGKSLTALAIPGLLPAGAEIGGTIRFAGETLTGRADASLARLRGRSIGLVFQEPMTALNPVMPIGAQVAETVRRHRAGDAKTASRMADAMLARVGLPASVVPRNRYPHELSGGQRQRVALALAAVLGPQLLIADEPTTALDPTTEAGIAALMRSLAAETGMALLLISHDLALVASLADRIAVLDRGRLVELAATPELLRGGTAAPTRALVAASRSLATARFPALRPAAAPILAASGLVRTYPGRRLGVVRRAPALEAVAGIDLAIGAGELVALVGESGSGKSTLLGLLLALDRPDRGTVTIDGAVFPSRSAAETRRQRRRIQAVFQDPAGSFDPRWRVGRIVAEPLGLIEPRLTAEERRRRVETVLGKVGLPADATERYPHQFSGGERQRIAIARALVVEPAILALDEATSALDLTVKTAILDLLAGLAAEARLALLFVTHDLATVRRLAERVLVMAGGRIVEAGPVAQIFTEPAHPTTRALIAAERRLPDLVAQA